MRSEQQVLDLFFEANPVSEVDSLELMEVAPTRYLATLEDRSRKLDNKIDTLGRTRWSRYTPLAIAALVITLIGVAWVILNQADPEAPVATEPTPTSVPHASFETFRGYWEGGAVQIQFDGNIYALLENGEVTDQGTYSLLAVSERITFSSNSNSVNCSDAAKGTYEYTFVGDDQLRLTFASDDCDFDRGLGQGATLTRTDPFSIPPLTTPEGPEGFDPADVLTHVQGEWVRQSVSLRFNADQYTVTGPTGSITDQGTVRFVAGTGLITFVSSEESPNCEAESAMTGNYSFEDAETMILTMTSESCAAGRGIQFSPNDQRWTRSDG